MRPSPEFPSPITVHPPKPRFALSIGVIGHRLNRLPEQRRSGVMTRICEVLEQLSRAAQTALERHEAFFANERAALTLISGLAEGTDRMAAQGAIEQGLSLTAILPFEIETYEKDFKQQSSRAEYRELISKATTLELCGDPKQKPRAYEAAGLTILDNSDIVLAVWDGETSAGRGGTVELIEIAAKRGLPIIHIDTTQRHPPRLIWGGLAKFPLFRVDLTDLPVLPVPQSLQDVVDKLVRPPADMGDSTENTMLPRPIRVLLRLFLGKREPTTLAGFFDEPRRKWNLRIEFPLLLGLLGIRAPRRSDILPRSPEFPSADFAQLACGGAAARGDNSLHAVARAAEAYGWVDTLANRYAQMYTGAYISNFILVALGVLAGAIPFAFDWRGRLTFLLGLACAALVYINTFAGNLRNWHKRWMEAREVAEQLRAGVPIWLLGQRPRKHPGENPTWVDWYVRANFRAMGVSPSSLNLQKLSAIKTALAGVLDDQAQYHLTSAALMNRIEKRLFVISTVLIVIVLLLATVWKDIELLAIVGLAALTAAIYGIRITGDFEGRAERSERTAATLMGIRDAMQLEAATLSNLRARAQTIYEMLLGENAQWRFTAQSRPLAIPG